MDCERPMEMPTIVPTIRMSSQSGISDWEEEERMC